MSLIECLRSGIRVEPITPPAKTGDKPRDPSHEDGGGSHDKGDSPRSKPNEHTGTVVDTDA